MQPALYPQVRTACRILAVQLAVQRVDHIPLVMFQSAMPQAVLHLHMQQWWQNYRAHGQEGYHKIKMAECMAIMMDTLQVSRVIHKIFTSSINGWNF